MRLLRGDGRVADAVDLRPVRDRSATGYLPPAEFEAVADGFSARPHDSVRGWERAVDAQRRVVAAVERAVAAADGDLVVVSHGGVGALLLCHLLGVPIDRRYDQPGQGSWFRFDPGTGHVPHAWRRLGEASGPGRRADEAPRSGTSPDLG